MTSDIDKDISEQAKKNLKLYTEIGVNFGNGSGDGKAYCDLNQIYEWARQLITKEIRQARQEIADEIGKMQEIQGVDGTWNYDSYMHGMYNGMEFCHALVKNVEPKYREAPKQWLADIPTDNVDGSGTTTLNKD